MFSLSHVSSVAQLGLDHISTPASSVNLTHKLNVERWGVAPGQRNYLLRYHQVKNQRYYEFYAIGIAEAKLEMWVSLAEDVPSAALNLYLLYMDGTMAAY